MNIEVKSPRRRKSSDQNSNESPGIYYDSTDTVQQNPSVPTDFMILYPSPELNLFDMKQALKADTISDSSSQDIHTSETIINKNNDLDSLHSFELWHYENRSIRPKSLPKERNKVNSEIDLRTNRSVENNLILTLKTLTIEDKVCQAQKLNQRIEGKVDMLIENTIEFETPNKNEDFEEMNEKTSINNCNCKKSKCLRLHCICFAGLKQCNDVCKCLDCKNNEDFKDMRDFVIEKTREINPLAFKPKIKSFKGTYINSRGCNCSKNNCLKRYCECFKSGSGCTKLCTCSECKNSQEYFCKDDIIDIKDKGYRRKHKIVINEPELNKRDFLPELSGVSFIKHKKKRKIKPKL